MTKPRQIHLVSTFAPRHAVPVKVSTLPQKVQNHLIIDTLKRDMARQQEQIRRLKEEVRDLVALLERALDGHSEGYDYIKRTISRLKGSLEYQGNVVGVSELRER